MQQIVREQAQAFDRVLGMGEHPVTKTLESVAKSLMSLPSAENIQNQPEPSLAGEQMAVESTNVAVTQCSNPDGVIFSMPDLSEFAPVVMDGVVQSADVNLDNLCHVEPMEEGRVTDSPIVDTFAC